MTRLYRMHRTLPSLALVTTALALLAACDKEPPARTTAEPITNPYLERLQEAEAVKHSVEQRNLEQQRIDELLGRGQAVPPSR